MGNDYKPLKAGIILYSQLYPKYEVGTYNTCDCWVDPIISVLEETTGNLQMLTQIWISKD